MKAYEIKKNIYWVGGVDWNVRNFHGYSTQRGTTYNAYLIIDDKNTLIDTVKRNLTHELIQRVSDIIDPSSIDYLISNHVEMDHSGSIPQIMNYAQNATIITSLQGEKGLKAYYNDFYTYRAVQSGEQLSLGTRKIQFVHTPMVHWPDNMVSFCPEEKVLFSNDAFGQHIASSQRFDSEYPLDIILLEAKKYYANIVLPYSNQVRKALETVSKLDVEIIAPSHGIVWKNHLNVILQNYTQWSSNLFDKKAVIIYDTMWNSTETMAYAIQDVFEEKGYTTSLCNLKMNHISDIMTDVLSAAYICVGSPTLNKQIMPNVASFLTYLHGLAPKNRKAVAFGSYGWNNMSLKYIEKYFKDAGVETIGSYGVKYLPTIDNLNEIKEDLKSKI